MTDQPMWRTVKDHGQPTADDLPILTADPEPHQRFDLVLRGAEPDLWSTDRWIPLSELEALPEAPPPPRMVTVELTEEKVKFIIDLCTDSDVPVLRHLADACRAARSKLNGDGDD